MIWLILLISLLPFVAVAWRIDDWSRDWTTNTAATSPQASDPWLQPATTQLPVETLAARLTEWVSQQPAWSLQTTEQKGDAVHLQLIRSTRLLRFKDDVEVVLTATPAGTTVRASSASRVGKGDLGQNPRNLRELMQAVAELAKESI